MCHYANPVLLIFPVTACPSDSASNNDRIGASQRTDARCQNVWPGRAVQDGLPRSTNVRAASMYQASEVEQFAPGHHGYPRASETRQAKDLEEPSWHPVSWLRRAGRSSISSFHLADLGGIAGDTKATHSPF